jgi:mRNA-degrading endonuclease toxin of MazEF toxin-antitoxin module
MSFKTLMELWLANLNPVKKNNAMGKIRPVLIFQNNELNHASTLQRSSFHLLLHV